MQRRYRPIADGEVHVLEWLDAGPGKPWLHFLHATGMNAELYRLLLDPLADDFNIVASDARGHGHTRLPADPRHLPTWDTYAQDLEALLGCYTDAQSWLLAGHSLGASVTMALAARRPERADAVLLIEPAMVAFAHAADFAAGRSAGTAPENMMEAQANRRRWHWPTRADVFAAYHRRGVFRSWDDAWLNAYLDGGTRSLADGSVELTCAPRWEAATFRAVATHLEADLRHWTKPLTLLYSTLGSTVNPADVPVFADGPGRRAVKFDGASHFLPIEQPEAMRVSIRALADVA